MMRWLQNARFVTLMLSVIGKVASCGNAKCGYKCDGRKVVDQNALVGNYDNKIVW